MNCSLFFEKIDSLYDFYVSVWQDVCNIESPSYYKEGVDAVSSYFAELSKDKGWDIERFSQEKFGDVLMITMNKESEKAPIVLSGHLDTVHQLGLFGYPPTRIEGGEIYGPGVTDCKGGVVAGFLAMHALHECGYKDHPVIMLLQSNEEVGSGLENKASIRYMCEKSKDALAFLNLEGHGSDTRGKVCIKRKGIAGFLFKVKGIAAHGSRPEKGASAILEASHKITELYKVKNEGETTFSVGLINGGSARNTVAAECEFQLDVRFADNSELESSKNIIEKISDTVYVKGCSCEVVMTNYRPAMEITQKNLDLLDRANKSLRENGMTELEGKSSTGGSDASDLTLFGVPTLDALGTEGGSLHSVREHGTLSSLKSAAKTLVTIITAF